MYYELFIDKFFLENMMMDYLLLYLVQQGLKCKSSHSRLFLGSFIGATGMCALVLSPFRNTLFCIVFGYFILSILMIKVACSIQGKKDLARGIMILFLSAFLLSGIWEMLLSYTSLPVIILEFLSFFVLRIILKCYQALKHRTENLYQVTVYVNGKSKHLLGLCDTGNQLKQPLTGKPVSIIGYDSFAEILGEDVKEQLVQMFEFKSSKNTTEKLCYIPYHSIGESNGLLPGLTLDYISIQCAKTSLIIRNVVVAVTKESVSSKGEYQMILHPLVFDN